MKKDMTYVGLRLRGVPGEEHADARLERRRHGYFPAAYERPLGPAESGARRVRGKGRVEVVGDREPDVPDVFGSYPVEPDDGAEQLDRGVVDRAPLVAPD